jgi:hypothetical protein
MTAIYDLTPMILPFVRDCSAPAAVVAARFAAIEFYKQTLWQQEMLEPVDLIEGQSIYELETPPDTVPATVMRVEIENRSSVLMPITKDYADRTWGSSWVGRVATPRAYLQLSANDICLIDAPDANAIETYGRMRIICAVQPTPDATEIDDSVFNLYAEALAYGARARLVETAGQPYYDPQSAPLLWGRFYGGVYEAKARRMRDHTRAVQSVQLRAWI